MDFHYSRFVVSKLLKSFEIKFWPIVISNIPLLSEITPPNSCGQYDIAKGQIISECVYEIIISPISFQKFPRFLPWPEG